MADILDYTQNTTPSGTDATYLVDDASGSPADNYIELNDIADGINHTVEIILLGTGTALTTGDNFASKYYTVPRMLNGYNLLYAHAAVATASTSGTPTFQIHNVTDSVDMLSTAITIDATETSSYTATASPIVDTTKDDVATGDQIRFDCDAAGSSTAGCTIIMEFTKP